MIAVPILLLFVCAGYYHSVAKKHNKNKVKFTLLGFLMPLFPVLCFILFLGIAHMILGHDPKGKIPKPFVLYGGLLYAIFILLLPQYFARKWKAEVVN